MSSKVKKLVPSLVCHPNAIPAFELTQFLFCRDSATAPQPERLKLYARTRKLQYFRKEQNNLFLDGWMSLLLNDDFTFKKLISAHPSNIEFNSWLYAIDAIVALSNKVNFLPNLGYFFDSAPGHVQARLFCDQVPRTTLAKVVKFSGESRASVRYYLQNKRG
ncbi:MAG: hypothetical protein HWE26_14600 [Alteromonadaceae bacterium]|nr:hypothetical protein [Alteromonadaceae bacterium]